MKNTEENRRKIAEAMAGGMDLDDLFEYVVGDLMDHMEKDDKVFESFQEDMEMTEDELC
jgi:hypothetical protein